MAIFLNTIQIVKTKEIFCETVVMMFINGYTGRMKTCLMKNSTTIDAVGATISARDIRVLGLHFKDNKNIIFLPDKVAETYSNLSDFNAQNCSIEEITNRNFKGLSKLKFLILCVNQIEKILSDTFEDLIALEQLWLRKK
jgi:hypothetical protein